MVTIRPMQASELGRISEIDRSEEIRQEYLLCDGRLHLADVCRSVPRWAPEGQGAHSVCAKISAWRPLLDDGGTMFGAFDGESLVGCAIYRPNLAPGLAQLAVLHVSRRWRRRGVGAALAGEVMAAARRDGASRIYVSATATRGTVEFYQALGFAPTAEPDRLLLEQEPEDIHMIARL